MIEAVNLRCERGERLLFSGLSFSAERGTLLRVAGPNGTGKTSLLRICAACSNPRPAKCAGTAATFAGSARTTGKISSTSVI